MIIRSCRACKAEVCSLPFPSKGLVEGRPAVVHGAERAERGRGSEAWNALERVVCASVVVPELRAAALEAHGQFQASSSRQRVRVQQEGEAVREAVAGPRLVACSQVHPRPPSVQRVAHVHALVEVQVTHAHAACHRQQRRVLHARTLQAHLRKIRLTN